MKEIRAIMLFAALATVSDISAQDPYFSQFYANRVYLNPAYTGFDPGTTITLNYRNQWFGVPDGDIRSFNDSYVTFNATAEHQLPCFLNTPNSDVGVALSFFDDNAGTAPLKTTGGGLAFSYSQKLGKRYSSRERSNLRFGIQTSFMQRSLNWGQFIYSDQLDPVTGLIGNLETLNLNSGFYPSLNAGLIYKHYSYSRKKNQIQIPSFTLGFSLSNVNKPNIALRDAASEALLPRRTTFHFGCQVKSSKRRPRSNPVFMSPQIRIDNQLDFKLNTIVVGGYISSEIFYTGLFYQDNFGSNIPRSGMSAAGTLSRNTNAMILACGLEIPNTNIMLGLTYDVNLSGLRSNNTLGVLECNIRVNFKGEGKKGCAIGIPSDCPRINRF